MEIVNVKKDNFDDVVLKSKERVLVDFNADWCGPCRMLKPILDEVASERDDVKIVSINIDNEEELAMKYGVSSIPCLVLFEGGKEVNRSVGFIPKDKVIEFIGE